MRRGMGLEYYRRQLCLSQEDLADQLGLSRMTVSRYESGKQQPRGETLKKLRDDISELLEIDFTLDYDDLFPIKSESVSD